MVQRRYPDYLVDKDSGEFLANISGGRVGAIAIVEDLGSLYTELGAFLRARRKAREEGGDLEMPDTDAERIIGLLGRAKLLSGSIGGKRSEQLVDMSKNKPDAHTPEDYGLGPRYRPPRRGDEHYED